MGKEHVSFISSPRTGKCTPGSAIVGHKVSILYLC